MTSPGIIPASPDQNGSQSDRSSLGFLQGGGEMGALIRDLDWCGHPLGKPEHWPQSLKAAVSLILNSQHPMSIGWGRELSFFYNDAYLHVLGLAKHPWALGRPASEVWSEIWDVCGPLAEKVFCQGEASFVDDVRLFMNRGEFLEESYYSFFYSPIRDEAGQVGGLFCPSNDVTAKVVGARRLYTLSELSSNVLVEKTADAACATAAATFAKNRDDIPFALLYLIKGDHALLKQTVGIDHSGDLPAAPVVDLTSGETASWPLAEVFRSGEPRVIAVGISDRLPRGTADQIVSHALVLPVVSRVDRKMIGLLVAGLSPARRMDADYRTFLELIASHIGTAIQNARAAEEEKKRADALAEIDRVKTSFFSNVSHEFRTPLTLMLGPLENQEQLTHRSEHLLPPDTRVVQQEGARARILLADDNADMREHVAHILGAQYEVITVADGRAALEEVRRVKPDLIVSDVMMPQLDGFGVLRELRANPTTVDIPVIMLSARGGEEARTEGMGAGADDYLAKSFSARELVGRVAAHLKLAQMRREAKDQSTRLLESITNGFFALDREWCFTYMNAEAERLNGIRREQLLGRSYWEIFPEAIGTTVHKELTRVMNERVPADFQNYFALWDRWFHIRAYPAADSGITVFFEDVTDRKRADRASRLLSAIVDSSDDAIISKDLNGIITSWNKAAQRLFGYSAEEAIGQSVASLLIPEDRQDEEPDILARLRRGEHVDHFETKRRRKDGTLLDISLTISPVRDADGAIIGASKIARDIGYRKRTERLDQEQKRVLEMIASGRPFEDCLVAVTQAVDRLRPGTRAAVLMPSRDGSAIAGVFSAHLPLWRGEALRRALAADSWIEDHVIPLSCRDIAGSAKWPDEWKELFLASGIRACHSIPILVSGRAVGSFLIGFPEAREPEPWELRIADFGTHAAGIAIERERVAAALRRSERDFRTLVEVGPQIVWLAGPQGELEFVNRRWIEFSGLDCEATKDPGQIGPRLHPEDKLLEHWAKSVAAGTPFELEARLRGKDGEFRWFMMRSVPLRDEQGRIHKWFGTSTDIHQNKLLQLQLRSANRDLEQFAYSVSHDLREPLRSVKLFSELLTRRYRDKFDGQALEFLDYLSTGASRMEMLVRDLLSYTQAVQPENAPKLSDASVALQDALSNLAQAIAETGARVEFDPLPMVPVHGTQLQQLFQNVVGNAIKYHRPGIPPVVRVCTQRQKDEWLFSVSDNGIGIESEYKERIFGLFKRLHTSDEYSGSGIGLALCQRIVERHNGRIWVESEPGKGSTFYFTLPG